MKIRGFREYEITPHVFGMDLQSFEVSLEFVLNSGVENFDIFNGGDPHIKLDNHAMPPRFMDDMDRGTCRIAHISARYGGRKRKVFGFLVYNSAMGFVDFLVNNYIPTGKTALDKFLRKDIDETKAMDKVYKMLFDDEGRPVERVLFYSAPALPMYTFNGGGMHVLECQDRRGRYFLQRKKGKVLEGRIFSVEEEYKLDGLRVPVRKFFVFCGWEHPIFYWDGITMSHFFASGIGSLKQHLGTDVWDIYDRKAECESDGSIQWFTPLQLVPTHLIRVPSLEEAKPLLKKRQKGKAKPQVCNTPLYLFDSRTSVRLTEDLITITELKDALSMLSRTIDGVYVPNDVASDPEPMLKNEPYFLVGVMPDEWKY